MNDIGKELYEQIRADFENRLADDSSRPRNMEDVFDYSGRIGRYLADSIAAHVTQDKLPDGRLYHNIARSILEPSLRNNYELVNLAGEQVQEALDAAEGIRMKVQWGDFPEERLQTVIGAASQEGLDWETALRRLTSPAETITRSFSDDFMKKNAQARSDAGFDTYITRTTDGKCCEWCSSLAGRYAYPDDVPRDVFRRHDNCGCSVVCKTDGMKQGQHVWSKQIWDDEHEREYLRILDEQKAERKRLAENYKGPVRLGEKEAGERVRYVENKLAVKYGKALTNGSESGIMNPSGAYKRTIDFLNALKVESIPTQTFDSIPSESEIINRLSGKDRTDGSCVSLAFAYAGNKGGVDVLDFRGGKSCDFFADVSNIADIARFNGVTADVRKSTNDFTAVADLLKNVESGKEYILVTGKHTAVIRKASESFEYLEMQSSRKKNNGFKPFDNSVLVQRFDCIENNEEPVRNLLIDLESLSTSNEFKSLLNYINTKK